MSKLSSYLSSKYTDKGSINHTFQGTTYLDIYDRYFAPLKYKPLNILEIGVSGHHNSDKLFGSSLWLWQEYFTNASIFGFDIDPICKQYERKGIHIEIGNQRDPTDLQRIINKAKNFDIIIDDGSHVNLYTLTSFNCLFPVLNSSGLYIIEDLGTSYNPIDDWNARKDWPGMHLNDPEESLNNSRGTMDHFFKGIINNMDNKQGEILSMHFWSEMCFIIKA